MRILAKEGIDAIYNGSLTQQLLDNLKEVNGIIKENDLINYE
jgi:gamma-glutamyltranspeptidase/glutathione hydrolase/leukotriene-C4 hydrolase